MLILHGDNQILSRQQFLNLKNQAEKSGKDVRLLSGADISAADLVNTLSTSSLFGQAPAIFIEGLFSRRPSHEKEDIISSLVSQPNAEVIVWESKDVSAQLKSFPAAAIRLFPLPKYIFEFLDTLSLASFQKSVSVAPVEQVFSSLITRIHKNLLINPNAANTQKIQQLLEIDYAQKNSLKPYDLQTAIELWLLSL